MRREQLLSRPITDVFAFFSDAYNLERLTPTFLRFEVVTPRPIEMRAGTLIDYKLKLFGVPMNWRTEIESFELNTSFVDRQIKGPYALWHHTHRFSSEGEATRMVDEVRYALPLWPIGELAHPLLVRRTVERIFDYRASAMSEIFS